MPMGDSVAVAVAACGAVVGALASVAGDLQSPSLFRNTVFVTIGLL